MNQQQITISTDDPQLFNSVIAGLVQHGLTFDARVDGAKNNWIIELTGGF